MNTKYGMVKTDHILFIAAGAFHVSKPSDLIPELQGRFPIRVELEPLGREDFVRILTEPKNALIKQYTALLSTEGVTLGSPTARSGGSPTSRRSSTSGPRTSARAGCTPSWRGCSTRCRSRRPRSTEHGRHDRRGVRRSHARRHRRATKICRATSCERLARSPGAAVAWPLLVAGRAAVAGRRAAARRGRRWRRCVSCRRRVPRCRCGASATTVQLRFTLPTDERRTGRGRSTLDRVEIYAVTVPPGTVAPREPRAADARRIVVGTIAGASRRRSRGPPSRPAPPPDTGPTPGRRRARSSRR